MESTYVYKFIEAWGKVNLARHVTPEATSTLMTRSEGCERRVVRQVNWQRLYERQFVPSSWSYNDGHDFSFAAESFPVRTWKLSLLLVRNVWAALRDWVRPSRRLRGLPLSTPDDRRDGTDKRAYTNQPWEPRPSKRHRLQFAICNCDYLIKKK